MGPAGKLLALALLAVIAFSAFQIVQGLTRNPSEGPRSEEERIVQDAMAAVQQDPKSAEARWRLSVALSTVKDYQRAFAEAEQAVKLNAKAPEPFYALGLAYRGLGDKDRAIKAFEKAGSIPGAFSDVYREIFFDLGETLTEAGRHKEAVKAFQNALVNGPEATYVVLALADAYKKTGDVKRAKVEYLAVLGYDPTNEQAMKAVKELGATDKEIEAAKKPVDHQPAVAPTKAAPKKK